MVHDTVTVIDSKSATQMFPTKLCEGMLSERNDWIMRPSRIDSRVEIFDIKPMHLVRGRGGKVQVMKQFSEATALLFPRVRLQNECNINRKP